MHVLLISIDPPLTQTEPGKGSRTHQFQYIPASCDIMAVLGDFLDQMAKSAAVALGLLVVEGQINIYWKC